MLDRIFPPSDILKPYVERYWTCRHESDATELMYPSGSLEFCIDISHSGGHTIRHRGSRSTTVPFLEVLGHWTIPTRAEVKKGNTCLITRFHPYASCLFFPNPASDFTNKSINLNDLFSTESGDFYCRIMEQPTLELKVGILEAFLIDRLRRNMKKQDKLKLVQQMCSRISSTESFNMRELASYFGFSERYIQKMFLECVGLPPKALFSVGRFNKSLQLLRAGVPSLTSIALDCGYYDQAHFIKEFKSFTALAPSIVRSLKGDELKS
jgi:AraC-like DNA-binding protein